MQHQHVTAVIVTYQSEDCIVAALDALVGAHEAGLLECIVVDNASSDATIARVQQHHPWVRIVFSNDNLGYGSAANIGWQAAASPLVLLLNPDIVIQPDAIAHLAEVLDQHPNAAIAGPAMIRPDGSHQQAGARLTPWRMARMAAGGDQNAWRRVITPYTEPFTTDWLCGAAIMIRRTSLEQVGGFDSRFFLYFEETDLCWRMVNAGWTLWAVGDAVASHHGGRSAKAQGEPLYADCLAEHYFQSRYYYLAKHHGRVAAVCVELAECALVTLRAGLSLLRHGSTAGHLDRLRFPILQRPTPS